MSDHPRTVAGLIDKRRELAGRIEHLQRELRALVADLDHIDAVIRIFDPEAVIGPAKRYPIAHQAFRGEMASRAAGQRASLSGSSDPRQEERPQPHRPDARR
jgi:hypothetical protein